MKKGIIFDVKRFAVHDGDGIRTTVFLKGCPLNCIWCHNPEGISSPPQLAFYENKCIECGKCTTVCSEKAHSIEEGKHFFVHERCVVCGKCVDVCLGDALKQYGKSVTAEELLPVLLEDRDFYVSSGGDCLVQAEFCEELLRLLKENRVHTAVDSCGFVAREAIDRVMPYTDVFLYDVKAIDEDVHICCTGQSNRIILQNLKYIDEEGGKIEIRIPYVPGYNDTQIELANDIIYRRDELSFNESIEEHYDEPIQEVYDRVYK